ncbi:uncharacterized protein Z519_02859 [Cladophialophora bantiana CBS 173.52]|uniref:Uncharacterized protein n=1 Tax=Cladophialophora bantiana (strain ATCC 10958 / CBS 173.52 / CDC B-1940 / NIH 8579) TaxID=1442370 RepID=A0A0D2HXY2_CLAB1|nr:uncharacterized protein Z519_02859 [Cladophialophora bantiana CBS 173.52]KIW95795.1 hypothetical protein Z519_02859 [Cladophialophora bantiana CBS 173.52]
MYVNRGRRAYGTHLEGGAGSVAAARCRKASPYRRASSKSIIISRWRNKEIAIKYTEEWMDRGFQLDRLASGASGVALFPAESCQQHSKVQYAVSSYSQPLTPAADPSIILGATWSGFEDLSRDSPFAEDNTPWNVTRRPISRRSDSVYSSFLNEIEAGFENKDLETECCSNKPCFQLPQSALPGLNIMLNLATTTSEEWNFFMTLAPPDLQDPLKLMDVVLRKRYQNMDTSQVDVQDPKDNNPSRDRLSGQAITAYSTELSWHLDNIVADPGRCPPITRICREYMTPPRIDKI